MRWSGARTDQTFIACLAMVATYLVIGDFGVRLANTSTDDGLVAYAYFYKYPELFARDGHMLNTGRAALASMLNWLPAVLFKYAAVPPEIFYWGFTFLQNILLALAMYWLTMVMVSSRESALIAALFTLAWQPHWWNVGLFGDLNWMPYGGWLALPFLVFAGAYALELRLGATALALLVGGLVHPILGLFAAAMIGAYWVLFLLRDGKFRQIAAPVAAIALASAAFLLPVLLTKLGLDEVPSSDLLPQVLRNGHAIPWANPGCSYCLPLFVKGMVAIPVIVTLALVAAAANAAAHPRLRIFLGACTAVALAAFLVHVAAYLAQNAGLLRVISTRATILLLAFAVPPLIWLAWRVLSHSRSVIARFVAGYIVVWPSPMALLAALFLLPGRDETQPNPSSRIIHLVRALGAALLALVLLHYVPVIGPWIDVNVIGCLIDASFTPHLFGFPSSRLHALLVLYLCAVLIWHGLRRGYTRQRAIAPLALAVLAPLGLYLLASSFQNGRLATSGEAREYYEVQVWARASTASNATFIVGGTSLYEGWRNFTHRARVTAGACGYYACTKAAQAEAREVAEFTARFGNPHASTVSTQGLAAFARAYGGDYAVRRKAWAPLDFPIAFQNDAYVVYDLR
jgi:hypothetical protein